MSNKIRILAVNGGNGVIVYPFKNNKFEILANIEPRGVFRTPKEVQWQLNFEDVPLFRELPQKMGAVDVIIGAPDCGHSSILSYSRAKKFSDPKENKSLSLFITSVKEYQPKMFFMENLGALLKNYGEKDLKKAFKNYHLKILDGPVSNYGNSQIHRKRLLIVGLNKAYPKKFLSKVQLPELNVALLKTSGQLISDLIPLYPNYNLCHVREPDNTVITIYAGKKMKVGQIKKDWLTINAFNKRLPVEGRNFTSAPGVYRNLEDDYPATARKQNRQFNHLGEMMSPRELARIQGIPDTFKLAFSEANSQYWINKGRVTVTKCPPFEMAEFMKLVAIKTLKKINKWKS